jgi:cytoskeletal protein RodZ
MANTNEQETDGAQDEKVSHEPPRGALLITILFLVALTMLWVQVYLQLLTEGGIPRQ